MLLLCIQAGKYILETKYYGLMESGGLETTTKNNRARTFDALHADAEQTASAGDDLLADRPLDENKCRQTGCFQKPYTSSNWKLGEVIDFTSHDLWRDANGVWRHARFKKLGKSVANLLENTKDEDVEGAQEKLKGLCFVIRHSPDLLGLLQAVATEKKWGTLPDRDLWIEPEGL